MAFPLGRGRRIDFTLIPLSCLVHRGWRAAALRGGMASPDSANGPWIRRAVEGSRGAGRTHGRVLRGRVDLFRLNARIAARGSRWRNDRHAAPANHWCRDAWVDAGRRADHPFRFGKSIAQRPVARGFVGARRARTLIRRLRNGRGSRPLGLCLRRQGRQCREGCDDSRDISASHVMSPRRMQYNARRKVVVPTRMGQGGKPPVHGHVPPHNFGASPGDGRGAISTNNVR